MLRILALSAYSFHQPLPSWLWFPVSCILESVLGTSASYGVLFFWLFSSSFLFLSLRSSFSSCHLSSFSCCSCSSSYLILSFTPSFVSSSCHPFSCLSSRSSCCLLSSNCPHVPFLPSLICLFLLRLCCLLSFPFSLPVVSSCLSSSVASRLQSTAASCLFFSCCLFLLFLSDHRLLGDAGCRHL